MTALSTTLVSPPRIALLLGVFLVVLAPKVGAVTCIWNAPAASTWHVPTNWNGCGTGNGTPAGTPGPADKAVLPSATGAALLTSQFTTVAELEFGFLMEFRSCASSVPVGRHARRSDAIGRCAGCALGRQGRNCKRLCRADAVALRSQRRQPGISTRTSPEHVETTRFDRHARTITDSQASRRITLMSSFPASPGKVRQAVIAGSRNHCRRSRHCSRTRQYPRQARKCVDCRRNRPNRTDGSRFRRR